MRYTDSSILDLMCQFQETYVSFHITWEYNIIRGLTTMVNIIF